jgi:hypothetical protein
MYKILAKRLTQKERDEILESFKSGADIYDLSEKYDCTNSTIIRNLKKNLGESKYKDLFNRSKLKKTRSKTNKNQTNKSSKTNFDDENLKNNFNVPITLNENVNASNFEPINSFFEIAPLDYDIDKSSRKELSSIPISDVDLPKIVYMIVDKKIELEIKLLKDFPTWEFLPDDDLNRKTIEIFFDLNLAKKSCNKDQKVLKVPNTNVFRITAPVLLAKGISRIVCPENLIAL